MRPLRKQGTVPAVGDGAYRICTIRDVTLLSERSIGKKLLHVFIIYLSNK